MPICRLSGEHLGGVPPDPLRVLAACARLAAREGHSPPAALFGDWLGAAAVIAPSVDLLPVAPEQAFGDGGAGGDVVVAPSTGSTYTLGFRSFPDVPPGGRRLLPEAVSGRADGLLVLGHDGWTVRGASLPRPRPQSAGPGVTIAASHNDAARRRPDDKGRHPHLVRPRSGATPGRGRDCLRPSGPADTRPACRHGWTGGCTASRSLFEQLWRRTQARRGFLAGTWGAVVSMSPETYLTRRGRDVYSCPIRAPCPRCRPGPAAGSRRTAPRTS